MLMQLNWQQSVDEELHDGSRLGCIHQTTETQRKINGWEMNMTFIYCFEHPSIHDSLSKVKPYILLSITFCVS